MGRVACWAVLIYALQRLARHWEIPMWLATAGIAIWLAAGQTIVGGEWMIGTFEAKCIAYICLLFAARRLCAAANLVSGGTAGADLQLSIRRSELGRS